MFWKKPTVDDLLKLYASMTDAEKEAFEKGKQSTAEEAKDAEEKIEGEPKDEQTTRDRVDETVAAEEKDDGEEDTQTAKDRIDEAEGEEKAIEKSEPKEETKEVGEVMHDRLQAIEDAIGKLTERIESITKFLDEEDDFGDRPRVPDERISEGDSPIMRNYYRKAIRR